MCLLWEGADRGADGKRASDTSLFITHGRNTAQLRGSVVVHRDDTASGALPSAPGAARQ